MTAVDEAALETDSERRIRLARATAANTFTMTANFYLAATVVTAIGEVFFVCAGTLLTLLVGTETAWTVYGVGMGFLLSNHLVAFAASVSLRMLAVMTRRTGGPPAIVAGLLAAVLPAVEVALALPASFCVAGVQLALWIAVWGLGLASAWRAVQLIRLEREVILAEER
ncbi:MAG: hypothetical protein EP330_23555 [Deltaproteobacteria bacterium]|nr:MAG: hypothetical protein EP330_23555 [Deltaproteobacteria bacterium]